MWHSANFVDNTGYQRDSLNSIRQIEGHSDRPLTVQFCANDPEIFSKAVKILYEKCPDIDAVDLNLGCPQGIAKKGHYGSFLQEEPDLISDILSKAVRENPNATITAKCRILDTLEETKIYIDKLCSTGIKSLCIHGRRRAMKGAQTGLADWKILKDCFTYVKEKFPNIAVILNGNIQSLSDVNRAIAYTNCDGVMSAEGILHNPCLFSGKSYKVTKIAKEYLNFVDLLANDNIPTSNSVARLHIFKLLHHPLSRFDNLDLRDGLATAKSIKIMGEIVDTLENRLPKVPFEFRDTPRFMNLIMKNLPYFICKPYMRPTQACTCDDEGMYDEELGVSKIDHFKEPESNENEEELKKITIKCHVCGAGIFKFVNSIEFQKHTEQQKQAKNLERLSSKNVRGKKRKQRKIENNLDENGQFKKRGRPPYVECADKDCKSPAGAKCAWSRCRKCCKKMCIELFLDCKGHSMSISRQKNRENITKVDQKSVDSNTVEVS